MGKEHLWKPGQSGNPNGRPKGAKGKATLIKQRLVEILEKRMPEAETMEFKDFFKGLVQLLPKEQKVEIENTEPIEINITHNYTGADQDKPNDTDEVQPQAESGLEQTE